jgi:hypothetical protein
MRGKSKTSHPNPIFLQGDQFAKYSPGWNIRALAKFLRNEIQFVSRNAFFAELSWNISLAYWPV